MCLVWTVGGGQLFHSCHYAPGLPHNPSIPQGGDVAFEVVGGKRLPASLLLPQHFTQVFRLVGLGLIPQERPQLGVRAAVKILRGGLLLVALFIMQNEIVRFYRLGYNVPEMLLVVQLIESSTDFPAHFAGQLHGVGKNMVAGLLPIKFPCVVLSGVLQEYVTFPETVRPGGARHPQQGFIFGLITGGGLTEHVFVNLKIILIKGGILAHDLFQRGQNIHILKLIHGLPPPYPLTSPAPGAVSSVPS